MKVRSRLFLLAGLLCGCSRTEVVDIRRSGGTDTAPVITHGEDVGPDNTGFDGFIDPTLDRPLTESDLTDCSNTTLSTAGAVVERCRFNGPVTIAADAVTLRACLIDLAGGGFATVGINITGVSDVHIDYCTVRVDVGSSAWLGIEIEGATRTLVEHTDVSRTERSVQDDGTETTLQYNFLHDYAWDDDPGASGSGISIFDGDAHVIRMNRIVYAPRVNACLDVSPYWAGAHVGGVAITDNFLDGGNSIVLIDNQVAGAGPFDVRVLRNRFGGHTNPAVGRYTSLNNNDGRPLVDTEAQLAADNTALLWPTSGPDVNLWSECGDLVPDLSGQLVD